MGIVDNLLALQLKSRVILGKDNCESQSGTSITSLEKVELTVYIELFFSVPIEFLSNQHTQGQVHFNIEGHAAAVRNPIVILFSRSLNSFEDEHGSLADSEEKELKLGRQKGRCGRKSNKKLGESPCHSRDAQLLH